MSIKYAPAVGVNLKLQLTKNGSPLKNRMQNVKLLESGRKERKEVV